MDADHRGRSQAVHEEVFQCCQKRDAPDWERQPSDAIAGVVDPRLYDGVSIVNREVRAQIHRLSV